ncbi:MAG: hypothetical protein EP326_00835, partial [Deltaproteobacteria bacterium]
MSLVVVVSFSCEQNETPSPGVSSLNSPQNTVNTDLPVITGVTTLNDKFQIIGKGCIQNGVIPMKLIAGAPQNLGGLVIGNYQLTPGQNLNSNQCQLASFVLEGD